MAGTKKTGCCGTEAAPGACCRVESLVSVDERGQMVLPKEVRDRAGIKAGDKLAVVTWGGSGGGMCCLLLIKTEGLADMVKGMLGPLVKELGIK
ncbi:MAG: AbrB/MazE/SpoVT family DNA-binding domain-containing protein [Deltaproteobacteria bacterium]|nr:AbrB/MazE/SpoVT family DNA-binding domain-containing protein [Deltaproteobacteria bacterium]